MLRINLETRRNELLAKAVGQQEVNFRITHLLPAISPTSQTHLLIMAQSVLDSMETLRNQIPKSRDPLSHSRGFGHHSGFLSQQNPFLQPHS